MTILKISGAVLIAAGLSVIVATLIAAKRSGTFEAIKELRRIRTSGYITEHKVYTGEDVYRNELSSSQSRLMSRRAKRVLEKMDQEDAPEKKQVNAAGTSMLEEVEPRRQDEERTSTLPQEAIRTEGTAILAENSEGTDPLNPSESTDVLTETEERTGVLDEIGEGTDVLEGSAETAECGEGTAVLTDNNKRDENRVDSSVTQQTKHERDPIASRMIMGNNANRIVPTIISDPKAECLSENGEETAILMEYEGTAVLQEPSEATGILDNGEGTDILEEEY